MEIFEAEKLLGLEESLANASVCYASAIDFTDKNLANFTVASQTVGIEQPDLFPFSSILTRTGFNKNRDFFPSKDTWEARGTIVCKPVNIEHNIDDIIGHQTAYKVVDSEMNDVDESKEAPDTFSIYDTSVIYRIRGKKDKFKQIEKIIEEIHNGEWWVSMEAFFRSFDYIIADMPDSGLATDVDMTTAKIIPRNKDTAVLTKYLRQYKNKSGKSGPGQTPDGKLIGRVLRDFYFTGKGLVKRPANPSSAIFTLDDKPLSGNAAQAGESVAGYLINLKGSDKEMEELEIANKKIAELEATVQASKLVEEAAIEAKKKSDELLAEANEQLKVYTKEKEEMKAKARLNELVAKVVATYKVETEKAEKIAETLFPLSDEMIQANLDVVSQINTPKVEGKVEASFVPDESKPTEKKPKITKAELLGKQAAQLLKK